MIEQASQDAELSSIIKLLSQGELEKARQNLAALLKGSKDNPKVLELAGTVLLGDEKNLLAAENSLKRALIRSQAKARILAKIAVAQILQKKTYIGESTLRKALASNPNEPLALLYSAWSMERKGSISNAIPFYEKLINITKAQKLSLAHTKLAAIYNDKNQYLKSISLLKSKIKNVKYNAQSFEAYFQLAIAYIESNQSKNAKKILENIGLDKSREKEAVYLSALLLRSQGEFEGSIDGFQSLIKLNKENATLANFYIAETYAKKQDTKKAVEYYTKAINTSNPSEKVLTLRAATTLLFNEKKPDKALGLAESVYAKNQNEAFIGVHFAELNILVGLLDEAEKILKQVIKNKERLAPPYFLLGKIQRHNKRPLAARVDFREAVKIDPGYIEAWIGLAGTYNDQGQRSNAINQLKKALELNPNNLSLAFELATLHDLGGAPGKANRFYRSIIKINPFHVESLNNYALNLLGSSPAE